jgi:hypothetical protein
MKRRFEDVLVLSGLVLFAAVLIYLIVAPPCMINAAKATGRFPSAAIYKPILRLIESDFGGPMLWYCNTVWHAGIILLGDEEISLLVLSVYIIPAVALLGVGGWWLRRRVRPKSA